jgi:hypothetical protein
MPSQQGLGLDEEVASAKRREEPAQARKHCSIRWPQGRTSNLAAQHADLVAEHDDLDDQLLLPTP